MPNPTSSVAGVTEEETNGAWMHQLRRGHGMETIKRRRKVKEGAGLLAVSFYPYDAGTTLINDLDMP